LRGVICGEQPTDKFFGTDAGKIGSAAKLNWAPLLLDRQSSAFQFVCRKGWLLRFGLKK
jgi:hypothetical protein